MMPEITSTITGVIREWTRARSREMSNSERVRIVVDYIGADIEDESQPHKLLLIQICNLAMQLFMVGSHELRKI
jgi:hypothetical protein